jgi:uncharacterized protein involved in outer membrane biogenesis
MAAACEKKQPVSSTTSPALPATERATPSTPVGTTQTVLQKTFALQTSAAFPFEIPAHAVQPHLHGTFQSFVRDARGQPDEAANLDFLVLNRQQYDDFSHGGNSEALFSAEASHNQDVNFDLPASLDQPVKYYLVFRSASGGAIKKVVEANFRVDF